MTLWVFTSRLESIDDTFLILFSFISIGTYLICNAYWFAVSNFVFLSVTRHSFEVNQLTNAPAMHQPFINTSNVLPLGGYMEISSGSCHDPIITCS